MSATFIESTHGKRHLCHLGYRYYWKRKKQNGSEYWICVKCNTTATSFSDLSVVLREEHTHLPDETDKEVLEMRKNKVITDECLIKLWKRYDQGRTDIPAFLTAAGLRYFKRPSKS